MVNSIIFDLDGTLWDATNVILDVWNIILKSNKGIREKEISIDELRGCMGLQIDEIGKKLFPNVDEYLVERLMKKCCAVECVYLTKNGGRLYNKVESTIKELSKKYDLYIASNCQFGYIESFLEGHNLGMYFKDYICAEDTGLCKGENIKKLIKQNNIQNAIYVGDTQGDKEASAFAGIDFVYARYGFGEVKDFNFVIEKFKDLLDIKIKA